MGKKSAIFAGGALPKPTGRELEIVSVLWERGSATVREVLEDVNREREEPLAYTTVLRFLQIMTEKGLVVREDGERTKRQLAHDLVERAFAGSTHDLVLHALGGRKITTKELGEIRKLVEQLENKEDQQS